MSYGIKVELEHFNAAIRSLIDTGTIPEDNPLSKALDELVASGCLPLDGDPATDGNSKVDEVDEGANGDGDGTGDDDDANDVGVELAPAIPADQARLMPARDAKGHFVSGFTAEAVMALVEDKEAQTPKNETVKTAATPGTVKVTRKPKRAKYAPHLVDAFVTWFFTTPMNELYDVKCGQYACKCGDADAGTAHTLIFNSKVVRKDWIQGASGGYVTRPVGVNADNIIGIRPLNSTIGVFNASRLRYGTTNSAQKRPQVAAEAAGAVPIPFENVVRKEQGAGLDLSKLQIVDWAGAEDMVIPPVQRRRDWVGDFHVINRHFAGAMVVRVEDKYFLFDADRNELHRFGFNPFFTQLPVAAGTVEEAYDVLKPEDVHAAEIKGRDVIRQGEFFFVPCTAAEILRHAGLGNMTKDQLVQFMDLTQRVSEVGACYYNWLNMTTAARIRKFMNQCVDHNAGYLPESENTTNPIDARSLFQPVIKELEEMVGSDKARGNVDGSNLIRDYIVKAEKQSSKNSYDTYTNRWSRYEVFTPTINWHGGYITTHMYEEADIIAAQCRVEVERSTGSVTGNGPLSMQFGVLFNVRIGGASEETRVTRGQHCATAVMKSKSTEPDERDVVLALGAVVHEGREHGPVFLSDWHRVYGNTATANWTVSGDVD